MDLLERYLQAVRFFLPRRQQDDILRELSDDLLAQMEDRKEELGRELTDDDRAEILRRQGHPLLVAGRYRSHQHLIGSTFFPMYLVTLKAGLGVALVVSIVLALLGAAMTNNIGARFVELLFAFPGRALMVFAWTTLSFALLDLCQVRMKWFTRWDPRLLPPAMPVAKLEHRKSRSEALGELLIGASCLVWLLLLPGRTYLLFLGGAARVMELAPVWSEMYLAIVVLTAAAVVISAIDVIRPFWTSSARVFARIGQHAGTLLIIAGLLRADAWVVAKAGATLPGGLSPERVIHVINVSTETGLLITAILLAGAIVRDIFVLRSRRNGSSSPDAAAAGVP